MSEPTFRIQPPVSHLSCALDAVAEGVLIINRDFIVTYCNRAAERITGVKRAAAVGRRCADVMRSSICGKPGECPVAAAMESGATCRRDAVQLDHDRAAQTVSIGAHALCDDAGRTIGGVETLRVLVGSSRKSAEFPVACAAPDAENGFSLLDASERQTIEAVLRRHAWNKSTAAQELGISRTTLWRKMRRLGIKSRPSASLQA
jgi:transcriptional regulator with PAS, ATPase and Fis domain